MNPLRRFSNEAHLRSLPELEMFPDDASREQAVRELNAGFYTWRIIPVLVSHIAVLWAITTLTTYTIGRVAPWLKPASGWLGVVVALAGYVGFLMWALPRDLVRELRIKLVAAGVPVCLRCGYDLRGQPADSERCPECGAERKAAPD